MSISHIVPYAFKVRALKVAAVSRCRVSPLAARTYNMPHAQQNRPNHQAHWLTPFWRSRLELHILGHPDARHVVFVLYFVTRSRGVVERRLDWNSSSKRGTTQLLLSRLDRNESTTKTDPQVHCSILNSSRTCRWYSVSDAAGVC